MMQAAIIMKFYSLLHFGIRLNAPLLLGETAVVVVTPLSVCLGGCEEFGSFGGILLHYGSVAYLTLEEVVELIPLRLFGVERERILALFLKRGIVAPEMPVATFNSL